MVALANSWAIYAIVTSGQGAVALGMGIMSMLIAMLIIWGLLAPMKEEKKRRD